MNFGVFSLETAKPRKGHSATDRNHRERKERKDHSSM
jgi:hypothetical protein